MINYERDELLTPFAKKLLRDYYMLDSEQSPQEAFARAATAYSFGDTALAQRIYDYASKGWFMFASPVLSNAPNIEWPTGLSWNEAREWLHKNVRSKAMPISCFLSYVPDSLNGLINHETELRWMTVQGGGVGSHWSDIRSIGTKTTKGGKTPGIVPFMHCTDSAMLAYHQGTTRRGNTAVYLDISHPEIIEFLQMRLPEGDINRQNLNLHHAVNITKEFMDAVVQNKAWHLTDPHSGDVIRTMPARDLWLKILETRFRTGEPYLNRVDLANEAMHPALKQRGLKIHGSNLCNEIHLPTSENRSAVCCLSSLNLERYDEYKHTQIVRDCIRFLDNVLEFFILMAPPALANARRGASAERSLGLGAMGFHSFLQKRGVPIESAIARSHNMSIFKWMKAEALEETKTLADERGAPDDLAAWRDTDGRRVRNAHLLAVAPNSNNSIILDCSASIEPWKANAFEKSTRAGSSLYRNKYLIALLEQYGKNTPEVWESINSHMGSVQHLDFLTEDDKDIFKTANEIDQHWIIQHASDRQEHICQGQSLNLFFPKGSDVNYVNSVHLKAMTSNVKGLYYLKTDGRPVERFSQQVQRVALNDFDETCMGCEG